MSLLPYLHYCAVCQKKNLSPSHFFFFLVTFITSNPFVHLFFLLFHLNKNITVFSMGKQRRKFNLGQKNGNILRIMTTIYYVCRMYILNIFTTMKEEKIKGEKNNHIKILTIIFVYNSIYFCMLVIFRTISSYSLP